MIAIRTFIEKSVIKATYWNVGEYIALNKDLSTHSAIDSADAKITIH